jgi:hypothetical protein
MEKSGGVGCYIQHILDTVFHEFSFVDETASYLEGYDLQGFPNEEI